METFVVIKRFLKFEKPFFVYIIFLFCGLQYCSFAYANEASKKKFYPTHQVAPKTIKISQEKNVLLVGIEPYLGQEIRSDDGSSSITLLSNGNNLILRDSNGIIHKSNKINIIWKKKELKKTNFFIRKTIGPFASFESAEKLAKDLKKRRIQSIIAHPKDWEVWVSGEVNIPNSIKFVHQRIQVRNKIVPYLNGSIGKIELQGPISIKAPDGLRWRNGVYAGPFSIQLDAYGTWTLVEHVPLERYLNGVVPFEIGSNAPPEALAAQAVLARTWAVANSHRFKVDGYNLCSSTQCQVYKDPSQTNQKIKRAIQKTAGKILTWNNEPINAVYHATNGGSMASVNEAWSTNAVPYLKSRLDGPKNWFRQVSLPLSNEKNLKSFLFSESQAFGSNHPLFRWERSLNSSQLADQLKSYKKVSGSFFPDKIKVISRGSSGRVTKLKIIGRTGNEVLLQFDGIRKVIRQLPSTLFVVNEIKEGQWNFSGGGFGHGAGMSQSGAIELAENGWTTEQILSHYYPNAEYGFLP